MPRFYELTVVVRTEKSVTEDAFIEGVEALANRIGGKGERGKNRPRAMHRVTEVSEREVPIPLRDTVSFGEGSDG